METALTTARNGRLALTFVLYVCVIVFLASCDSSDQDEKETLTLTPVTEAVMATDDLSFKIRNSGAFKDVSWQISPVALPGLFTSGLSWTGVWISESSGNVTGNVTPSLPYDNSFSFAQTDSSKAGYFIVDERVLEYSVSNWPYDEGAPSLDENTPKLYGDQMAWASFKPSTNSGIPGSMDGVKLSLTAFVFESGPLENVIFTRYDVTNVSGHTLSDVSIGYGGDVDIQFLGTGALANCDFDYHHNKAGYDLSRNLVYSYSDESSTGERLSDECSGLVGGFAFVPITSNGNSGPGVHASTIVRRTGVGSYPEFSVYELDSAVSIDNVLHGLSPAGNSMVNPDTNQPSMFSFTGDPVHKAGWLDEQNDVRLLQSLEPISVMNQETIAVMVVWMFGHGDSLENGIKDLFAKYDDVIANRGLWDY